MKKRTRHQLEAEIPTSKKIVLTPEQAQRFLSCFWEEALVIAAKRIAEREKLKDENMEGSLDNIPGCNWPPYSQVVWKKQVPAECRGFCDLWICN